MTAPEGDAVALTWDTTTGRIAARWNEGHASLEVSRQVVDIALDIYNAAMDLAADLERMHGEQAIDLDQWPAAAAFLTALGKDQA